MSESLRAEDTTTEHPLLVGTRYLTSLALNELKVIWLMRDVRSDYQTTAKLREWEHLRAELGNLGLDAKPDPEYEN